MRHIMGIVNLALWFPGLLLTLALIPLLSLSLEQRYYSPDSLTQRGRGLALSRPIPRGPGRVAGVRARPILEAGTRRLWAISPSSS